MNRVAALKIVDELHRRQNNHYGGGDDEPLRTLLSHDVVWSVPGQNLIAGTYRGWEEVSRYFSRRRDYARGTFRMELRDLLVGEGDRIAALTDGVASIGGQERRWSTVGLYELTVERKIRGCWLLPLNQPVFDEIWS